MKTLIVSGVPLRDDTNSGKTLQALFASFEASEIAQLYFSPDIPNSRICGSYYQLCEKQMITSFFGIIKNRCGGRVEPQSFETANAAFNRNPLSITRNKRSLPVRLLREMLWRISFWKNQSLKLWLEEENPDVIFAVMQDTNASVRTFNWLAKQTKCSIILYVTDDYYYDPENSHNLFRRLYYKKRQKLYKKLSGTIVKIIGCSEKITSAFTGVMGIKNKGNTIFTPSAAALLDIPYKQQTEKEIIIMRYFGNLGLGRWQMLRALGTVISEINQNNIRAILEVYSSDIDESTHKELTVENGCVFKGWVHGQEYLELLKSADIAVHIESFEKNNIRRTWGSVSTKIADYLGAGKCILAIGPKSVASIEHIKDSAFLIDDLLLLKSGVEELINDADLRTKLQVLARESALKQHNIKKISPDLKKIINSNY